MPTKRPKHGGAKVATRQLPNCGVRVHQRQTCSFDRRRFALRRGLCQKQYLLSQGIRPALHNASERWQVLPAAPPDRRGSRLAISAPSRWFVCLPAASNRAALSILRNWVWFSALYISERKVNRRRSLTRNSFMNVRSQLLIPGPRITSFVALPRSPIAGRANTSGFKNRLIVRSPFGKIGFDSTIGRTPSPPPVISALSTVVDKIGAGAPLIRVI